MIAYLKGDLVYKDGYGIQLEVGGIGYELALSSKALGALPAVGATVQVWTYLQVKEDGISLFGFASLAEKEMFERLIGVSGIGPKIALAALSTMRPQELAAVIAQGDITRIAGVPGIGKKTAQRIVLELQGVLKTEPDLFDEAAAQTGGTRSEASEALVGMGFSVQEVAGALKGCTETDVSAAIRYALKNLGGNS